MKYLLFSFFCYVKITSHNFRLCYSPFRWHLMLGRVVYMTRHQVNIILITRQFMKDKLTKKRIKWMDVVINYGLYGNFKEWLKCHPHIKKFLSNDRRAYYYFLDTKGRDWIKAARKYRDYDPNFWSFDECQKAAKVKWINLNGEDYEL